MRRTLALTGSYILNQRVVPDWWHPYDREDAHENAKNTLSNAIRRDEEGDAVSAASASVAGTIATADGSSGTSNFTQTQGHKAIDDSDEAEMMAQLPDREDEDGNFAETSHPRAHSLSLYDVNALAATFTSNHDVEELSKALQYLRERLEQPLSPFHYHALFRVFNHGLDRDNVLQLLDVMAQRGETTLETYARAIDCLHCVAPSDALARMLEVVYLAQQAFGTLVMPDTSGSEAATVAAYANSAERQAALEEPNELPGPPEAAGEAADDLPVSAPVLTALLHHLATSGESGCDPVAVLLVALWIRALGVRLSDWDCVHVVSALLSRVEEYPRLRGLLGAFDGFPTGAVSPAAVLERLEQRNELSPSISNSAVARVAAAMRRSLTDANIDMSAAVEVGVLNDRSASLRTTLQHALQQFEQCSGGGPGAGLGSHGYNPALLFHTVSILHSSLRDNAESTRVFLRAAEREEGLWRRQQGLERQEQQGQGIVTTVEGVDEARAEPFAVGHQYLMDVGSLLPSLSARTREALREAFLAKAQHMTLAERQSQLQDTLAQAGSGDHARPSAAVAVSAAAPPLRPSPADLVGVEGYALGFTRTHEEAAAALQVAIARVDRAKARLPRETRLAFKQLAQYCGDHPLPNPKLTPTGLAERRKWGAYLDARDTALSLFGSAKQARDAMKHLYYNDGSLPALRSSAVIEQDFHDTVKLFFRKADPASSAFSTLSGHLPESGAAMEAFTTHRTTQPHVRGPAHAVPPHLYDPDVFNMYPHVMLRKAPVCAAELKQEAAAHKGDLFAELWRTLMNPAVMGNDLWYLRNTDMYLLLMRCLLHRLDWEAAAHLTTRMLQHTSYTYLMDHELTTIFREVGDPAGCLAFKVATKLFDGRIMRDGQTKRERFHQEQFQ